MKNSEQKGGPETSGCGPFLLVAGRAATSLAKQLVSTGFGTDGALIRLISAT